MDVSRAKVTLEHLLAVAVAISEVVDVRVEFRG